MKKKINYRFLTILLCFMFLFFVGCDGGPGDMLGDDTPKSLDGVKVITRPIDYDFDGAVGEASQYYYNLFAKNIVLNLSGLYQVNGFVEKAQLVNDFDKTNGLTFEGYNEFNHNAIFGTGTDYYYILDGMRFALKEISTIKNDVEDKQILTFDTSASWLWALDKNATGFENIFKQLEDQTNGFVSITEHDGDFVVTFDYNNAYNDVINASNWQETIEKTSSSHIINFPDYQKFYVYQNDDGTFVNIEATDSVDEHAKSPYYETLLNERDDSNPAVDYFQDAMEYVTYIVALGYDYTDSSDAPYFNFEIETNTSTKIISNIYVTFNGTKTAIGEALGKVKQIYQDNTNLVGLTEDNLDMIKQFIIDKVIGEIAYNNYNAYAIKVYETINGVQADKDDILINKNYDKFLDNLLSFACEQAPIGKTTKEGTEQSLSLSDAYMASQITDYAGDYFFLSYENNKDDNLFKYIVAAEYQCLILNPRPEQIGHALSDVWLVFEYDEPEGYSQTALGQRLPYADELTLDIGLRYFDCTLNGGEGGYVYSDSVTKTIPKGNANSFNDNLDANRVYMGHTSTTGDYYDLSFAQDITLNMQFKDYDPINASKNGEGDGEVKTIPITGISDARKYFKMETSADGYSFGSLNPDMFSQNGASLRGEQGTDYLEVYFVIHKDKGSSKNYNFKVGIWFYEVED